MSYSQLLGFASAVLIATTLGCSSQMRHPSNDPDFVAPLSGRLSPSTGDRVITITSWNVKHLGRKLFDSRQAAPLLADADIVTFQEVNSNTNGAQALQAIAEHLQSLTGEKMCLALSEKPSDDNKRYGYLWKNSRVSYVKTNGDILEDCPETIITVRLGVKNAALIRREPAFGTFYFKPAAKLFVLSSIHLVPIRKRPQDEVVPLFQTFAAVDHPLVIAGDYNLDSTHPSFEVARSMGFLPAMTGVKTSLKLKSRELNKPYDNFWYRSISLIEPPRVINLYDVFTEKDQREIYNNLSDHCPITGKFEFP
jgi:hypothetical protein